MTKLLIDSDVLLDFLFANPQYGPDASSILEVVSTKQVSVYTTVVILSNVAYTLRKFSSDRVMRNRMFELLSSDVVKTVHITTSNFRSAMLSDMPDYEDALQAYASQAAHIDYIITRNVKDYKNSPVPAMTPAMFLATLER